ncbi:MAG: XRE family transcriptional regulator [bacterium]|nr:XRE family transcriptional regulator [bacterium]
MDWIDEQSENIYKDFVRAVAKNVRQKRIRASKTVEDIAYDALQHNSTSFYNSAENFTHNKHFNLKHLFLIAHYYGCDIREFFSQGVSSNAPIE